MQQNNDYLNQASTKTDGHTLATEQHTAGPAINMKKSYKGASPFLVIVLFMLLATLVVVSFNLDLGRGPIVNINMEYFNQGTSSTTNRTSPIISEVGIVETKSYAADCPEEQLKLITDASTLNGATVSCWPNTVFDSGASIDSVKPVRSVVCPAGKSKVQSGSTSEPYVRVECE